MLAIESKNVKALFRRGNALFGKQDYQEALRDLTMASELSPTNVEIKNMHAMCKMASRAADRKQMDEFSGMFDPRMTKKGLYKGAPEIPQWQGPLPTAWLDVTIDNVQVGLLPLHGCYMPLRGST